ncbi:MAG: response regulator transcription factor [Campylobacterales bacterium]
MKILLLEDEYMLQQSIKTFLEGEDYSVDAVEDGQEALNLAMTKHYDLFILDLNTPSVSGLEVLRRIRERRPDALVVVISAYTDIEHLEQAYDLGCNDYLKKPFELKELKLRLDRLIRDASRPTSLLIQLTPNYQFDPKHEDLYYKGNKVHLTKKERHLLRFLVRNLGETLSEDAIFNEIYRGERSQNSTIRSLINRLRGKTHENFLKNVRGVGYRIDPFPPR